MLLAILVLCCAAPCTHAQLTPNSLSPVSSAEAPKVQVRGTVVNSATGEPLRRALVSLSGSTMRSAFTDDEGQFAFEDIKPGNALLQARKPGFFTPHERGVIVDTAKSTDSVELKLTPSGVIYGQIIGAGDEPLERVPLRVLQSRIIDGRRRWMDAGLKASDEDGRFRIPDLKPGIYKIAAGPTRSRELDSLDSGYALTYYPNSPDRNSAATIQLLPARQMEINFKLERVPLFKVSGTVLGGTAQRTNVQLLDTSDSQLMMPMRSANSAGGFEGVVPAGRYNLRAISFEGREQAGQQGPPQIMTARTSISVTKDLTGLVLTLQPTINIPVVIRKEASKPEALPVSARPIGGVSSGPSAMVRLLSLTDDSNSFMGMQEGPPEDPALVVSNVQPGTYEVEVLPQGGPWYVASAQCGSKNLLREPLTVSASGRVDPIEIVLRDDGATLQGSVRGATAYGQLLIVSDSNAKRRTSGNYGPDGRLYAPALAPGSYTIYAFDHPEEIEFANPDALQRYQSKAAHITLSASQTANVTLDMIETEE